METEYGRQGGIPPEGHPDVRGRAVPALDFLFGRRQGAQGADVERRLSGHGPVPVLLFLVHLLVVDVVLLGHLRHLGLLGDDDGDDDGVVAAVRPAAAAAAPARRVVLSVAGAL